MSDYNGWKNWATWNAKVWIDNDEGSQSYWSEQAVECLRAAIDDDQDKDCAVTVLANALEAAHDEGMPEVHGVYADLLNSASREIDWHEIAESMIGDAEADLS